MNYSIASAARSEGRAFAEDSLDALVRRFGWNSETFAETVESALDHSEKIAEVYEWDREDYRAERQHEISAAFREALATMDAEAARVERSYMV